MIDKEFLAWAAGFFDGEGSVIVSVSYGKGKRKGAVWTSLKATIGQCDRAPLERLREEFGGGLNTAGSRRDRPSLIFQWGAVNREALNFLGAIHPYTVVNADEIAIALRYPFSTGVPWRGRANPMPEWVRERRLEIREQLMELRAVKKIAVSAILAKHDDAKKSAGT